MAEVLNLPDRRGFWPVDKVVLPYYAAATIAILLFWNRLPHPGWLFAWHLAAIAIALWAIRATGRASWLFHHWYPLPYVAWCYREMAVLWPKLRGWEADADLARLDHAFWGVNPTVWLEQISSPILTEYLQMVYALFVPAVLLIAYLLLASARGTPNFVTTHFLSRWGSWYRTSAMCWCPPAARASSCAACRTINLRGLWITSGYN